MKSTNHAKYNINYHIVWIPKYRKQTLVGELKERLENILYEIAKGRKIEVLGLEIQPDHIHLFISSPPANSPALLVNWFKGISARFYNHRFGKTIKWTRSYYVGTAGTVTSETIKRYIEQQKTKRDED